MADAILTLNAGSSSIKFALFAHGAEIPPTAGTGRPDRRHRRRRRPARAPQGQGCRRTHLDDSDLDLDGPAETPHKAALRLLVDGCTATKRAGSIAGVGHRVVHGAQKFSQPIVLDAAPWSTTLRGFIPLAPLHQPHNLAGIDALSAALPGVPQVACFDTAFHRSQPEVAQLFALPRAITAQGVRRYGFHGLSYEYIAEVLPQRRPRHGPRGPRHRRPPGQRRLDVRHDQPQEPGLDHGLHRGRRPDDGHPHRQPRPRRAALPDGLPEDGRQGADPLLYKESGLLGVSGISQDMRVLLESAAPEAREAVELFCYRIVREIGSLAAALGGLDALVFTGGIGERGAQVRQQVCSRLGMARLASRRNANEPMRRKFRQRTAASTSA
jgi:acetate kinase